MEDVAAPLFSSAAAVAEAMEEAKGGALPPVRTVGEDEKGDASARGNPCSVASDCSSVASAAFESFGDGGLALVTGPALVFEDSAASSAVAALAEADARCADPRSVFSMDCVALWGCTSKCGRRLEMEDGPWGCRSFSTCRSGCSQAMLPLTGSTQHVPPSGPLLRRLRRPRGPPGRELPPGANARGTDRGAEANRGGHA